MRKELPRESPLPTSSATARDPVPRAAAPAASGRTWFNETPRAAPKGRGVAARNASPLTAKGVPEAHPRSRSFAAKPLRLPLPHLVVQLSQNEHIFSITKFR